MCLRTSWSPYISKIKTNMLVSFPTTTILVSARQACSIKRVSASSWLQSNMNVLETLVMSQVCPLCLMFQVYILGLMSYVMSYVSINKYDGCWNKLFCFMALVKTWSQIIFIVDIKSASQYILSSICWPKLPWQTLLPSVRPVQLLTFSLSLVSLMTSTRMGFRLSHGVTKFNKLINQSLLTWLISSHSSNQLTILRSIDTPV